MAGRKKIPEDMALFRRKMGDVRPLKVEKRVPPSKPRTVKKPEPPTEKSPGYVSHDSGTTSDCFRFPEKRAYESVEEALSAAQYIRQERQAAVRPYLCHACGKFHLTSNPKQQPSGR